jgi:hypothetical protein
VVRESEKRPRRGMPDESATKEFISKWRDVPYDGLRGTLPEWVPAVDRSEFALLRFEIFFAVKRRRVSWAAIKRWFRWSLADIERLRRETRGEGDVAVDTRSPRNTFLRTHLRDISWLAQLFSCVQRGPEDGFRARVGEAGLRELKSREQRRRAQRPRADRLQELIIALVRSNPGLSYWDLLTALKSLERKGVVQEVTEEEVWWTNENDFSIRTWITGLKDRLSRAKKRIRSR